VHLASLSACSTSYTFITVDGCIIIGVSNGVLDAPVIDSSEYATATTTAITDIAKSLHYVANRVYKTHLLRFVKKSQGFFLRNVIRA
jgi:hypothetical protein